MPLNMWGSHWTCCWRDVSVSLSWLGLGDRCQTLQRQASPIDKTLNLAFHVLRLLLKPTPDCAQPLEKGKRLLSQEQLKTANGLWLNRTSLIRQRIFAEVEPREVSERSHRGYILNLVIVQVEPREVSERSRRSYIPNLIVE